jgi:hypothetical protein
MSLAKALFLVSWLILLLTTHCGLNCKLATDTAWVDSLLIYTPNTQKLIQIKALTLFTHSKCHSENQSLQNLRSRHSYMQNSTTGRAMYSTSQNLGTSNALPRSSKCYVYHFVTRFGKNARKLGWHLLDLIKVISSHTYLRDASDGKFYIILYWGSYHVLVNITGNKTLSRAMTKRFFRIASHHIGLD